MLLTYFACKMCFIVFLLLVFCMYKLYDNFIMYTPSGADVQLKNNCMPSFLWAASKSSLAALTTPTRPLVMHI